MIDSQSSSFTGRADRAGISQLLQEFVAVPSVNPALDGGPGEARLVTTLQRWLENLGLTVSRQEVCPLGRDNVLARLTGALGAPTLLFEVHLDTVPPSGDPEIHQRTSPSRVYGRGACDAKGSLVAILEALRLLRQSDRGSRASILFAGTVDEEVGAEGAKRLVDACAGVDLAVVGEPTGLAIALAHRGVLRFRIKTLGVAAHTARPELGVNAIQAMARVIDRIENQAIPELKELHHPLLGSPSLTIATIEGGTALNIVPSGCQIAIDRRLNPGENAAFVLDRLDAVLADLRGEGIQFLREEPFAFAASLDTAPGLPLVQAMREARRQVLGADEPPVGVPYGSDASIYSAAGVPSVVFGPGSIVHAHSDEEWIEVEDVARAAEILAELARLAARWP